MKRLFKMLSVLGILLILGSCESSKNINVATPIIGDQQYVQFLNYKDNGTYPVLNVSINGVNVGIGSPYPIDKSLVYTITWQWISPNASGNMSIQNNTISKKFSSNHATILMRLGTHTFKDIYYEDYLY